MATDKEIIKKESTSPENISTRPELVPVVDIFENDTELLLKADFPGVLKDVIDIHYEKNELTIYGKANAIEQPEWNPTLREFYPADYRRSFRVSKGIDVDKITAEYTDGVLTLHLPKSEAHKPRQIKVLAG